MKAEAAKNKSAQASTLDTALLESAKKQGAKADFAF